MLRIYELRFWPSDADQEFRRKVLPKGILGDIKGINFHIHILPGEHGDRSYLVPS